MTCLIKNVKFELFKRFKFYMVKGTAKYTMEINHVINNPSVIEDTFSIHSDGSILSQTKECIHSTPRDIYCRSHNKMICRNCSVKHHRSCDIQTIAEVSKEFDKDAVEKLCTEIESIKVQIASAVNELGNEKSILYKEKEKAIRKIKDYRSEMSLRLAEFENEALQCLDTMFTEYKKNTEANLKEAEQNLTSHSEHIKGIALDDEERLAKFTEFKETQKTVEKANEALRRLKVYFPDIQFIPNSKLDELMSETTTLGACEFNFKRDPKVVYEVAERREVKVVPEKGSVNCNITGADHLPDAHILLTDRSNKKLLRLGTDSNNRKDHIKFPSEPWGVCVIHATEAAVSFPEEQKNIRFISIAKKMRVSRALKLRHTCRALAYNGEELLVSDQGVFVYLYALDGTLHRKFSKDGHSESKLTDFHSIAVKDNLIVLADWNEGLIAFDKDGKLIWKYEDTDLKRAGGLCFDESGNILACGSQSINVIHINKEGKKIGEIANTANGLVYPTTLCYDRMKSVIVVAQQEANVVLLRVR